MSIASKMLDLQRSIKNPTKDSTNPFLKNKYASLGAVVEAVKDACNKAGIFIAQECRVSVEDPGTLNVVTKLVDSETGDVWSWNTAVKLKEISPQGSMGAFTYGRRYGLLAGFCLTADDDDANEASGKDFSSETVKSATPLNKGMESLNALKSALAKKG